MKIKPWKKKLDCGCTYGHDGESWFATACIKGCKMYGLAMARAKMLTGNYR